MREKQLIKKYFDEIVTPTVNEFLNSYHSNCDIRKAVLAALVLNHVTDHMAEVQNIVFSKMKDQVEVDCPETKVLREISNITKHRYLTSNNADKLTQEDHPGIFGAPFGQGYFAEANFVRFNQDGHSFEVPLLVKTVFQYWDEQINNLP